MIVTITKKDLMNGKQGNATQCMTARAIRRATGIRKVTVSSTHANVAGTTFDLPKKVRKAIDLFDNGKVVKPFTFRMPRPKI
jgi:hypothetical protein